MSSENDDIIGWLESQFSKDKQKRPEISDITKLLWAGAHLSFDKPSLAVREIHRKTKPSEAAAGLFWYCYHFSDECNFPDIYLDSLKRRLTDERESLTREVHNFVVWATDILPELIAFRDSFVWTPRKGQRKGVARYVQTMITAARILMLLRKYVDNSGRIEYSQTLRGLIELAYGTVFHGISEADTFLSDVEEEIDKTKVFGEAVMGFSACIACGIIYAAYAHMMNMLDEAYETSFHAYVDSLRYIRKADRRWPILRILYAERSLYLSECLAMYDRLVKQPEVVKDWSAVKNDFGDFGEILRGANLEEHAVLSSGVDASPGLYFATQTQVVEALARLDKSRRMPGAQGGVFSREQPFSNVIRLREILGKCTEYIWWADPHFRTRALAEIVSTAKLSNIKEVRILSRSDMVDDTAKSEYIRFRREMRGIGITTEWRTIKRTPFHDRFIVGANVAYNVPPVGVIYGEEYAEWSVCPKRPPFEAWWQSATPV